MVVGEVESDGKSMDAKKQTLSTAERDYALLFKDGVREDDLGKEIKNERANKILSEVYSNLVKEFSKEGLIMFTLGSLGKKYESEKLSDIDAVIIGNRAAESVDFEFYKKVGEAIGNAISKVKEEGIIAVEYPSDEGDVFLEHLEEPKGKISKLQAFVYQSIPVSARYDNDKDNFISVLADGRLLIKNGDGKVVHAGEKESSEKRGTIMKIVYATDGLESERERIFMSAERRIARSIVFTYSNPNLSTELLAKDALSQLKSAAKTVAELYNKYIAEKSIGTYGPGNVPVWKPAFGNLLENANGYPEYIKEYVEKVGKLRKEFDELSRLAEAGEQSKQDLFRKFIDVDLKDLYVTATIALNRLNYDMQNKYTETLKNAYRN